MDGSVSSSVDFLSSKKAIWIAIVIVCVGEQWELFNYVFQI
jgi:hypothetical protein